MSVRPDALPELERAWSQTERDAAAEGIRIAIADFGGFRTKADTTQILAWKQEDYNAYAAAERSAGRTPLPITGAWDVDASGHKNSRPIAAFGTSFHDFAAARDFKITAKPKNLTTAQAMRRVQDLAEKNGLRSGRSFGDNAHLELAIPLETARLWFQQWQSRTGRYAPAAGSSSASGSTLSGPNMGKVAFPKPGGTTAPDDGSGGQPGGISSLLVVGVLGAIGVGLVVARVLRGGH